MTQSVLHTCKAVERMTGYSGNYLRKLVRDGFVSPIRDASDRFLYSDEQVAQITARRKKREASRRR